MEIAFEDEDGQELELEEDTQYEVVHTYVEATDDEEEFAFTYVIRPLEDKTP